MTAKENLKPLKALVWGMGALLLGGTALLAMVVYGKFSQKQAAGSNAALALGRCAQDGNVDLRGRGAISASHVDGHVVRMVLAREAGRHEVVAVDVCQGRILSAVTVLSDAAAAR